MRALSAVVMIIITVIIMSMIVFLFVIKPNPSSRFAGIRQVSFSPIIPDFGSSFLPVHYYVMCLPFSVFGGGDAVLNAERETEVGKILYFGAQFFPGFAFRGVVHPQNEENLLGEDNNFKKMWVLLRN